MKTNLNLKSLMQERRASPQTERITARAKVHIFPAPTKPSLNRLASCAADDAGEPDSAHGRHPQALMYSIIIPAKNEEASIARCINSLLAQTVGRGALEIILVDNGSSDRTAEIAASLGARVESMPQGKIAALRNRGAALAQGEVLAFIDADMEMPANFLAYFAQLRQSQSCDVLGLNTVAGVGGLFGAWENRNRIRGVKKVDYLASTNLIMTRAAFDKVGGFDENLQTGEDKDLVMRLSQAGFTCLGSGELTATHWGADSSFLQFVRKEYWRQQGTIQLIRKNGCTWRVLRFPVVSALSLAALVVGLLALPVWPKLLPLILALSFAFTCSLAVTKWQKRAPVEILGIAFLALIRFWVAGAAALTALPALWQTVIAKDPEQERLEKLAAEYGLVPTFRGKLENLGVRILMGIVFLPPALLIMGFIYFVLKVVFREKGPFFYACRRVGQYKKPFNQYKIRTLKENASQIIGSKLYTADMDLTIRGGDFLRRTRLDEMPQLFNLLRGDINIIGPRPMRVARLTDFATSDTRFLVKPGLTGVSQMITPHHTPERVRSMLDNRIYCETCSVWMQFKWIWLTCFSVGKKVVQECLFKFQHRLHRGFKPGTRDRRAQRRLKANNTIILHEGEGCFPYPLYDISYTSLAFMVPSEDRLWLMIENVHDVTLMVHTKHSDRIARCTAKFYRAEAGLTPNTDKIILEYTPNSEYSRYLIDKYVLRECILSD